jgi:hypothetical protein
MAQAKPLFWWLYRQILRDHPSRPTLAFLWLLSFQLIQVL